MLHPNKENQRPRGNQRKLAFPGRRRKPAGLAIDPSAPLAARNSFFGTVGSPIKPVKMSDADTDAPAAAGPKLRRPGRPTPRGAASVDPEAATLDVKQKAALRKELARQAAEPDNVATVKAVERHGRRERRRSTEFLGAAVEPAQQLKLDGAKKAKIPHFLSAWFNAGNESKETEGTAATAGSTEDSAAPTAPAVVDRNNAGAADNKKKKTAAEPAVAPPLDARAMAAGGAAAAAGVGRNDKTKTSVGTKAASIDFSEITLGRLIGEGAFGKVHEAKWRGKAVAVKLLICQDLRKDILSEFMSEVEIMSVLRHPNICRLLGASLEPPNRALVVELLQRGSLWGVLRTHRKQIDQDLRSRFIYDTAKGMAYLHHFERPILHRDLKSPNLLVDKNFNIKLSDFGLARVKAHVQTMTGNCGTVQWMAPEVLGNQKYTEKADVFSFGIVIWEIVAGECPYDGMAQIQVALGVLNRNLRPNIPRDCPPFFSRLMKACWNRQPELRPSFPHIVNAFRTYQSSISDSRPSSSAAASAQAAMAASVAAS